MVNWFFLADCAHVAVPTATEIAMRHYYIGNILWLLQLALSFVIPLLFLTTGFSAKLGKFSRIRGKYWFFSIALYLLLFIAIYQLISLPLDFYTEYVVEHEYGLSIQTLSKWIEHYAIWTLLFIVGAILFVWIFYLLLQKSPKNWWFYSSIVAIAITFFITFISPIWIDPLFDTIGPMKNKELEAKLLAFASKAGLENSQIYEIKKSDETHMANAYVTGLFGTERIVIWDTAIKPNDIDGLLFTLGHEMGHYVLNHNWWFMFYYSIATFLIFYLTYRSSIFILHHYNKRFRFNNLYDIASLPLLLLLINLFTLLASPVFNYISRDMEREADRFGLELTQNNFAAATLFRNFALDDLANPNPGILYTIWRCDHPALKDRIEFCNSYCPWEQGQPLKYAKYFKD